jgi:DNA-binding CsgD family transcriptional regulator
VSEHKCARPVPNQAAAAVHGVKPGEVELLVELAGGRTVRQLARRFRVADGTVSRWLGQLRRRVGAETNPQLVAWAYQTGVLEVFVG